MNIRWHLEIVGLFIPISPLILRKSMSDKDFVNIADAISKNKELYKKDFYDVAVDNGKVFWKPKKNYRNLIFKIGKDIDNET